MPREKCKDPHCGKLVRIPPNRAKTATGYCLRCYKKRRFK